MTPSSNSRKRDAGQVEASSSPPRAKVPKGMHPLFLKHSDKPSASFVWKRSIRGTCLHGIHLEPAPSHKVAALDLDGTIIKTKSGNRFPRDKDDWIWWRSVVPQKLKALHEEGFAIVIISNQGSTKKATVAEWKLKIPLIANQLPDVPFRILAAQEHDGFRKPLPWMWTEFKKLNQNFEIDTKVSFFVGDAAGRPGDHNDSDRKWALNVGLPFFTPEEYFLGSPSVPFKLQGFNPSLFPTDRPLFMPTSRPLVAEPSNLPEVVLFVGYPASGKTSLYRRYFQPEGYEHVNQDTLKTRSKCVKAVENFIKDGTSCVVDNTNRNVETRKDYVDICKKLGVPVRCFKFSAPLQLCWHNNLYRAFCLSPTEQAKEPARSLLPQMAFTSFRANYEEPTANEGFTHILCINWRFEGSEDDRKRWNMWLEIDKTAWLTDGS